MVKWHIVHHQVAVAGRVIDAGTGKPIAGATVSIGEGPEAFKRILEARARQSREASTAIVARPDQARTAADGIFYFLDLPDGDYTLSVSLASMAKRYGLAQAKTTVSRDKNGDYKRLFLEVLLQATTVRGKITGQNHKTGVAMAKVRMKGSGEGTFSDARGEYVLAGIEPIEVKPGPSTGTRPLITKRTVLVFAQGYRPASKQVAINEAGATRSLDFELVREAG